MNKKPKVTVLMSVYKEDKNKLMYSIESILNQTWSEFEFIIINDGNNEELIKLVDKYNDNRIRLINNVKNIGLERSLNKGLKISSGKYIVRMDADDFSYPNRIEKQYRFISKHPEYSVVSGNAEWFDNNGIIGKTKIYGEKSKNDLIIGTPFIHPTMIIKKDILEKVGGYPNYRRVEDYAMIMNLYANGYKGYVMKDILIKYRMDKEGYKKKKIKDRFTEVKVKYIYFKKMNIQYYKYIFILKPLIVGIIPSIILQKYQRKKLSKK